MNSRGPELLLATMLVQENSSPSSTVPFLKLLSPTILKQAILLSFLVWYQLCTTSLINWIRNQIVELWADSLKYLHCVWNIPWNGNINHTGFAWIVFPKCISWLCSKNEWILVLQTSSKYATSLEQWKLPRWVVSFSCDYTRPSDLLGEEYLGLERNLSVTHNLSRAETLFWEFLSVRLEMFWANLSGRKKCRFFYFIFF